jgi:hypothetical protein
MQPNELQDVRNWRASFLALAPDGTNALPSEMPEHILNFVFFGSIRRSKLDRAFGGSHRIGCTIAMKVATAV